MSKVVFYALYLAVLLFTGVTKCADVSSTCLSDDRTLRELTIYEYKRSCLVNGGNDSILSCLLDKINKHCTEVTKPAIKASKEAICAIAWIYSLPSITPNTCIINETPDEWNVHKGEHHVAPTEGAVYDFMYYRVDYNSLYNILKLSKGREASEERAEKWMMLFPRSFEISATSTNTMPLSESMNVKLHGGNSLRHAFHFLIYYELFMPAVKEKCRMYFRSHVDALWYLRSHLKRTKVQKYLGSLGAKFTYLNYVYLIQEKYNLRSINVKGNRPVPRLPFLHMAKDDFSMILDGTNLLPNEDLGCFEYPKHNMEDTRLQIDLERLIDNLKVYINDGKGVMLEKIEPFYIAEVGIMNSTYSFYEINVPKITSHFWKKPARYMISAHMKGPNYTGHAMALIKIFSAAAITTLLSVHTTLHYLTHAQPWKI